MIMEIPLKEELEQEMNYWLKNEDGSYYEYRFLYELKINLFATFYRIKNEHSEIIRIETN
jgi:hypothetical protein